MRMKRRSAVVAAVLLALIGVAYLAIRFGPPLTLDQAVSRVYGRWLTPEDRDMILRMPKDTAAAELHM